MKKRLYKRFKIYFSTFITSMPGLPSNTWFLRPNRVLNLNGISSDSAVFAGLTSVTDRLTDWQTTLLGL